MSVTIRLARTGRKNLPAYQIVVANTKSKRNGYVIDMLGSYNPSEKTAILEVDKDKVALWQGRGALMTESVKKLLSGTYEYISYPSARKLKLAEKRKAYKSSGKGQ